MMAGWTSAQPGVPLFLPSFLSPLLTQVNEEDHIRVISMQKGGNMKEVFGRFCTGLKKAEEAMKTKG